MTKRTACARNSTAKNEVLGSQLPSFVQLDFPHLYNNLRSPLPLTWFIIPGLVPPFQVRFYSDLPIPNLWFSECRSISPIRKEATSVQKWVGSSHQPFWRPSPSTPSPDHSATKKYLYYVSVLFNTTLNCKWKSIQETPTWTDFLFAPWHAWHLESVWRFGWLTTLQISK